MNQPQTRARNTAFAFLLAALSIRTLKAQDQPLPSAPESSSLAAPTPNSASTPVKRSQIETSVSLGAAAQLTATRQGNTVQAFDPSVTVLGTVRQSFRPLVGYTVNFGYTRTTEENAGYNGYYGTYRSPVPSNVYELSLAYTVQKHITPRLTGFADLGGGVLTFLPIQRVAPAVPYASTPSVLFRQLGVAGVGMDYHFNPRLALRAEYRGLLYKYPDYQGAYGRGVTVSSQPTISLTYTFGRQH